MFAKELRPSGSAQVVQVEEEERILESRPEIVQLITAAFILSRDRIEALSAEAADQMGFPRAEAQNVRGLSRRDQEEDLVQIGELLPGFVRLPVVRVSLEKDALPGDVFLEAERTKASDVPRRSVRTPHAGEFPLAVRRLQEVAGQDRDEVEDALTGSVGLRELELDAVRIELPHFNRLSPDDEQVPLRRSHLLVEIRGESEHHVVRIERMSIGEAHSAPELEGVPAAVLRHLPGLREARFGQVRSPIDVHEVGHHELDDRPGGRIHHQERVEGLGIRFEGRR